MIWFVSWIYIVLKCYKQWIEGYNGQYKLVEFFRGDQFDHLNPKNIVFVEQV